MSTTDANWALVVDEQEKRLTTRIGNMKLAAQDESLEIKGSNSAEKELGSEANPEEDEPEMSVAEASLLRKILRSRLVTSTHDIEVQRKDPNSPLHSVKSFEELRLRPELLKGVYAMGFTSPSKIQESALPMLLADPPQNMIAQSQSGTGKTAAFVLAMLSRVDSSKNHPQVLCLSPTYELALQTGNVAKKMAEFCHDIRIRYAVRGEEISRGTKVQDHVIIGTPGKVLDWGVKFQFFDLKLIRVFVLDEADIMIATQGHRDQSIRIHKNLHHDCQMMLFSATYDGQVMDFAGAIIKDPITIRLKREEESLENIKQLYVECKNIEEKYLALSNIYGVISIGQAIIFCHTKKTASWLAERMTRDDGHAVALLIGDLAVEQRIAVLDRFRKGVEKVLITTNVCARGIDVEQVNMVVNFDVPVDPKKNPDFETYLHRIGRTGRFGRAGIAVNMVDGPQSLALLKQIEVHFGREIIKLDPKDSNEIEKIAPD